MIDEWVIDMLETNLGLIQIVEALDEGMSTDGWWLNAAKGIHITTFNDSDTGETLYHARTDVSGDWNYRVFVHWPEDVKQASDCVEWQWHAGKMVYCEHCPKHGHLRWVDFTSYCLRPIPRTLLGDIYDLSGLSPDWKEGRRDLKMSSEASDALNRWADSQQWENVSEEVSDAYQDV